MALTLIRHTRVATAEGLCYGRTDVPLATTFAEEAAAVRTRLTPTPRLVFTSPSTRCRRLAEILGAEEVRIDARLVELDFGQWENRRWSDLPRAEVDRWAADFVTLAPPDGESLHALAARVDEFRQDVERILPEGDLAVVTHGGVIRAWLCRRERRPLQTAFERTVAFGACLTLESPL